MDETHSGVVVNQARIVKLIKRLRDKNILTTEEATDILTKLPLVTQ